MTSQAVKKLHGRWRGGLPDQLAADVMKGGSRRLQDSEADAACRAAATWQRFVGAAAARRIIRRRRVLPSSSKLRFCCRPTIASCLPARRLHCVCRGGDGVPPALPHRGRY